MPKIVLQSFGKTKTVKTSRANSTEVHHSAKLLLDSHLNLQNQNNKKDECAAPKALNKMKKTQASEYLNKESPAQSSVVNRNDAQRNTLPELKDEQASKAVTKVRGKSGRSKEVIKEALSNPDILGPRQLRRRTPAVVGVATRGETANKRRKNN